VVATRSWHPLLAATTARVPRRVLLITALLVLGLANLVSALAPTCRCSFAGRVLAAAGAAAYTPIAAAVCTASYALRCRVPALAMIIGGILAVPPRWGCHSASSPGRWLGGAPHWARLATVCVVAGDRCRA